MNVTFKAVGLVFEAEVMFSPGVPPTRDDPGEPDEIEILTLRCANADASFLADSDFATQIAVAALEAAKSEHRQLVARLMEETLADRYEGAYA